MSNAVCRRDGCPRPTNEHLFCSGLCASFNRELSTAYAALKSSAGDARKDAFRERVSREQDLLLDIEAKLDELCALRDEHMRVNAEQSEIVRSAIERRSNRVAAGEECGNAY